LPRPPPVVPADLRLPRSRRPHISRAASSEPAGRAERYPSGGCRAARPPEAWQTEPSPRGASSACNGMRADQEGDELLARPVLTGRPARQLKRAARAAAACAPESLTVVRYRAKSAVATIARLASTAILAYVIALQLPGTTHPVLAPLTALLVVQVSVYQTLRSAARRITAVLVGVLLAVGLSVWVGFTWWSLGLTIVIALAIGFA
jgi:Aromatic acid exporter family member 1